MPHSIRSAHSSRASAWRVMRGSMLREWARTQPRPVDQVVGPTDRPLFPIETRRHPAGGVAAVPNSDSSGRGHRWPTGTGVCGGETASPVASRPSAESAVGRARIRRGMSVIARSMLTARNPTAVYMPPTNAPMNAVFDRSPTMPPSSSGRPAAATQATAVFSLAVSTISAATTLPSESAMFPISSSERGST